MADVLELEIRLKAAEAAGDAEKVKDLLKKIQDEQDRINAKAEQFSRRGFFGGQISEQIKKIGEAFAIAGNAAASAEARSAALRGAWGMIGSAALGAAQMIYQFAHNIAESEARLADHEARVRRLGPAYNEMRAQTAGVITSEQALAVQQAALNANLNLSADQLGRVARAGREHAATFGGDATSSTQAFFQALQTGDRNVLARFGVSLGLTGNRARDLDEAMRQLAANQARTPPMPPSATESLRAFDDEIERGRAGVTRWILEALSPGRDAMRLHREEVQRNAEAAQAQAREIAELENAHHRITTSYNEAARAARSLASAQREAAQAARTDRDSQLNLTFHLDAGAAQQGRAEDAAGSQHSDVAVARQAAIAAAAQRLTQRQARRALLREVRAGHDDLGLPTMFSAADVASATGGGGGGGGSNPLATLNASIARIFAAEQRIALFVGSQGSGADTRRLPGEPLAAYGQRIANLAEALEGTAQLYETRQQAARQASDAARAQWHANQLRQNEERGRQLERATVTAQNAIGQGTLMAQMNTLSPAARAQLERQRRDSGQDITTESIRTVRAANDVGRQLEGAFTRTQTFAQNVSGAVSEAFGTMTQSFTSHVMALASGRENLAQASLGIANDIAMGIAQQSIPKALFELASGIAAQAATLGVPNPISVMHFTSAAMFGALAAGGLALGAGTGAALAAVNSAASPPSAGSAASDRGPASTSASGTGAERGMGKVIVVNFNGAPIHTLEQVHDTVANAANIGRARGAMLDVETLDRRRRAG